MLISSCLMNCWVNSSASSYFPSFFLDSYCCWLVFSATRLDVQLHYSTHRFFLPAGELRPLTLAKSTTSDTCYVVKHCWNSLRAKESRAHEKERFWHRTWSTSYVLPSHSWTRTMHSWCILEAERKSCTRTRAFLAATKWTWVSVVGSGYATIMAPNVRIAVSFSFVNCEIQGCSRSAS